MPGKGANTGSGSKAGKALLYLLGGAGFGAAGEYLARGKVSPWSPLIGGAAGLGAHASLNSEDYKSLLDYFHSTPKAPAKVSVAPTAPATANIPRKPNVLDAADTATTALGGSGSTIVPTVAARGAEAMGKIPGLNIVSKAAPFLKGMGAYMAPTAVASELLGPINMIWRDKHGNVSAAKDIPDLKERIGGRLDQVAERPGTNALMALLAGDKFIYDTGGDLSDYLKKKLNERLMESRLAAMKAKK